MRKGIDHGVVGHIIGVTLYGFLTVLVVLLWARTGHCKERITFTVSPAMCLAPCQLTFSLRIKDSSDELWCPKVTWEWPDGTRSVAESDCDPNPTKKDMEYQSWTKRINVGPGEHVVIVTIEKGKMRKRFEAKADVR